MEEEAKVKVISAEGREFVSEGGVLKLRGAELAELSWHVTSALVVHFHADESISVSQ